MAGLSCKWPREPAPAEADTEATFHDWQSRPRIPCETIVRIVCRHFRVEPRDVQSARRTLDVVGPRQLSMYLAKILTPLSLPQIGRRIGGRGHTTVLHAVRRIKAMIAADPDFKATVDRMYLRKDAGDFVREMDEIAAREDAAMRAAAGRDRTALAELEGRMTASPYDRGYAEGLRAAVQIARRAAEAIASTGERRVIGGAVAALTGLAEEIEAAMTPAAPAQAERAP